MRNLQENVDKRERRINDLVSGVKREKGKTKAEEKVILGFVNEIHHIVQSKDEKQYLHGLMRIYDGYVR